MVQRPTPSTSVVSPQPSSLSVSPHHPVTRSETSYSPAAEIEDDQPNWDILTQEWLSDEPELETDFHRDQIDMLLRLMKWYWRNTGNVYCSGNTTVYYDENQLTTRNFRGPDIFVVMGVDPRPRKSWMIWKEGGKYPNVVFELLSKSTAKVDRTTKKTLYQDVWRLPNYFWFHPETKEFQGFKLVNTQYQPIQANALGHLWSDQMEAFVGIHKGMLRLFSRSGALILLEEEDAQEQVRQAQEQAQQAQEQAQQAVQKSELLAQKLRELGVDPNTL